MLAQVFGGGSAAATAAIHQAVDRLGKALHAVAFAPDGVMEAGGRGKHAACTVSPGSHG